LVARSLAHTLQGKSEEASLFHNTSITDIDPRSLAQRIMEVRAAEQPPPKAGAAQQTALPATEGARAALHAYCAQLPAPHPPLRSHTLATPHDRPAPHRRSPSLSCRDRALNPHPHALVCAQIRAQLAVEFMQDLTTVADDNKILQLETLQVSHDYGFTMMYIMMIA
jgi:hypothetical protein